jgi:hypothetical protein
MRKRLSDRLMSRRWQAMRYESRMPVNKPASRASRVGWLCQNPTASVLLAIIVGTIGWRVAYSLLRGIDSFVSRGTLPFEESEVALQRILGQELGMGAPRAQSYLRMAHLTYRGLVRQIPRMLGVAMPQSRAAGGNGWSFPSPLRYRYRYWHAPGICMSLEFETRRRQTRGVTVRVNA